MSDLANVALAIVLASSVLGLSLALGLSAIARAVNRLTRFP